MKAVLTGLTILVAAAVVVALAGHLVLIAVALIKANRNLEKLVGGLEAIRDDTAPLDYDLATINGALLALRDRLVALDGNLQGIVRVLRGQVAAPRVGSGGQLEG